MLQVLYTGLVLGSIYAVSSVGLCLLWSTIDLINLAHGALITLGGYVMWQFVAAPGAALGFLPSFALTLAAMFAFGMFLDVGLFRRLRRYGEAEWELSALMLTIGLAIVVENGVLAVWGPRYKELPVLSEESFRVLELNIGYHDIGVAAIGLASLYCLWYYVTKIRGGMAMRAVSQDREVALLSGINLNRVFTYSTGLGVLMAGVAGILLGSIYMLSPPMGNGLLFKSYVIVIFGGIGSMRGSVVAAYILGLSDAVISYFLGYYWSLPVFFVFMIAVLLIRPRGLFGVEEVVTAK